ncbi:MAG: TetR/AcrR family transcriptional regulator [Myxococcales bacterium]|nr:TetR/AcrR family transcriptional regulator [Myxococcales bacterium]
MSDNKAPDQRERILTAAARLFAERGYGGTGVRQIAAEAGVAISMVNYYFGSKDGLLRELLDMFHVEYLAMARAAFEENDTIETRLRAYVRGAVRLARQNGDALRVAFLDLPKEAPGALERRTERMRDVAGLVCANVLEPLHRGEDLPMIGPAIGTMIMSHFMARPMVERIAGPLPDTDEFYDRYAQLIADQLLFGLLGKPG